MTDKTQSAIYSAAGLVAGVLVGIPVMIKILLAAVALDIVTGVLAAIVESRVSSEISRAGMARKALIVLATLAAEIAGRVAHVGVTLPGGAELSAGAAVAGFYACHEVISITENIGRAGVPLPRFVRERMAALKTFYEQI